MGVLLMLMTIGGLIGAAILLAISLITKKTWLRNFTAAGVAIWFGFYALMLLGFSLFSSEKTLAVGEAKRYCGFYLDCHIHAAVTGVRTVKTLGDRTANGDYYIVKVKVFSDARRATLGLLMVNASVLDNSGGRFQRDRQAEANLAPQPEFETRVSPLGSFEKEIVFDLPADVQNPRLDLREGYGVDHMIEAVLVDDEDSIFHKRDYFGLAESKETADIE